MNSILAYSQDLKKLVEQRENYCWYLKGAELRNNDAPDSKPKQNAAPQTTAKPANRKKPLTERPPKPKVQYPVVEGKECPLCGKEVIVKTGKYGKFIACSDYPECAFSTADTGPIPGRCPKCGRALVEGKTKKGYVYYRCETGMGCGFITWYVPTEEKCKKNEKTLFWPKRTNERVCLNPACSECDKEYAKEAEKSAKQDKKPASASIKPVQEYRHQDQKVEQPAEPLKKKYWNSI